MVPMIRSMKMMTTTTMYISRKTLLNPRLPGRAMRMRKRMNLYLRHSRLTCPTYLMMLTIGQPLSHPISHHLTNLCSGATALFAGPLYHPLCLRLSAPLQHMFPPQSTYKALQTA